MKDIDFDMDNGGELNPIILSMVRWGSEDLSDYKMNHLYYIFSTSDVSSSIEKPDGTKQMTLDSHKTREIFKNFIAYADELDIQYGMVMMMGYSMFFTNKPLEVDPLYFKLISGWNIVNVEQLETSDQKLKDFYESANNDIRNINRYLDYLNNDKN